MLEHVHVNTVTLEFPNLSAVTSTNIQTTAAGLFLAHAQHLHIAKDDKWSSLCLHYTAILCLVTLDSVNVVVCNVVIACGVTPVIMRGVFTSSCEF